MRVEPAKPRYVLDRAGAGLSVSVPTRRNWFMLVFVTVWLGGWTMGGATALAEVTRPGPQQAFMAFWLVGWLCGELYALAVVAWQIAGREEIAFGAGSLSHRVSAIGLGRSREFHGAEIRHLRASPEAGAAWMDQRRWMPPLFGAGHGAIAFDYGAKTYRIGAGLDEAEARLVLAEVRKQFPRMVEGDE